MRSSTFPTTQAIRVQLVVLMLVVFCDSARAADPPDQKVLNLGIAETMFEGKPKSFQQASAIPFLHLMKISTGIKGQLYFPADPAALAAEVEAGKVDLAILQGDELAALQVKYPDLTPILIAVQYFPVRIVCVVREDSKVTSLEQLSDQWLSLSPWRRPQCELFLSQQRKMHQKEMTGFEKRRDPSTAFDAIFNVIDGASAGAIVHEGTLKSFESFYPGQYRKIRILSRSELFPDTCIAMKKNGVDPAIVGKLCDALLGVEKIPGGKSLLAAWKLEKFTKVPKDYQRSVDHFRKSFLGVPEATKDSRAQFSNSSRRPGASEGSK